MTMNVNWSSTEVLVILVRV